MFQRCILLSLALASLTLAWPADATFFEPKMGDPQTYKDIQDGTQEVRDNIASVSCGGWSVTGGKANGVSVTGDIPIPDLGHDLPGRTNSNPLFDPPNGVGQRSNFEFPDTTFGYKSSCDILLDKMYDPDLAKLKPPKDIILKVDGDDPGSAVSVEIKDGAGFIDVNPKHWCVRYDKAVPVWCKKLYEEAWPALAAAAHSLLGRNTFCPDPPADALWAPTYVDKHFCMDRAPAISDTNVCIGQECRTTWLPEFENYIADCAWQAAFDADGNYIGQVPVDNPATTPNGVIGGYEFGQSSSYYRHYAGGYMEPGVHVNAPGGGGTWNIRAECYEYYKEDDPRDFITSNEGGGKDNDEQCEFVIHDPYSEQNPKSPEWDPGDHQQKENVPVPPATDPARDPRSAPDPWVVDDSTNLSVIDVKKLQDLQKAFDDPADITGVVGAIIPIKLRATQITTTDHARTDIFDDTDHRGLGDFWERQEKLLQKMVVNPTTRLLMPARFLVGLNEDNPLFQYVRGMVSKSNGTVELTLRAGPEDLGNALQSLMKTYVMPIREVRIPILLPLMSDEEINARIFDWQQWKQLEDKDAAIQGRASFSGDADPLIAKLQNYKANIQQQRALRNAVDRELTRLYDPVRQFERFIADWYQSNTSLLQQAAVQAKQGQQLKRIWRHVQNSMLEADACQLQWCSNMRYSPPIYSLLDNWWAAEGQPLHASRDQGFQPDSLESVPFTPAIDQMYDFSFIDFPATELLIPVLAPIQVKVKLPIPPMIGSKPQDPTDFPDLPNLPDASVFDAFPMPTVHVPAQELLQLPPAQDLSAAKDILRKFRKIVDGKSVNDQIDEENAEEANGGIPYDEGMNPTMDRHTMVGAYCRFIPSIMIPPDPEEKHGNPAKILHVENDLRERAARLFSRWLPERFEDYAGRMARLNRDFPAPAKPPCKEDIICMFLPAEKTTTVKWQMFFLDNATDFNSFGDNLRNLTLPLNEIDNPYGTATIKVLKRLFPNIDFPITVNLSPSSPA